MAHGKDPITIDDYMKENPRIGAWLHQVLQEATTKAFEELHLQVSNVNDITFEQHEKIKETMAFEIKQRFVRDMPAAPPDVMKSLFSMIDKSISEIPHPGIEQTLNDLRRRAGEKNA